MLSNSDVAKVTTFFCTSIGLIIGCIWGYVRATDRFFTELYNILANVPQTIYLILLTYIMERGFWTLVFAMCVTGWLAMARNVRNLVFMIRDREYNLASRCLGTPLPRMISKNLVPYLVKRMTGEYLVPNSKGKPLQYSNYRAHFFSPFMEKLGLDQTVHATRHTFVSTMDACGVSADSVVLKRIVGHSNTSTTELYTHKSHDELIKAIDKFKLV